jgi:hypothetical protein
VHPQDDAASRRHTCNTTQRRDGDLAARRKVAQ